MSFKGTSSIIELPMGRSHDPKNGWTVTRKYKGTPAAISAKINELLYDGCKIIHDPPEEGGWETITCVYSWDPTDPQSQNPDLPLSDIWALAGNQLEKRLWELPKVAAELAKITDTEMVFDFSIWVGYYAGSVGFDIGNTSKAQGMAFTRKYIEALVNAEYTIPSPENGKPIPVTYAGLMAGLQGYGLNLDVFKGLIKSMAKNVESYPVSQYVLRRQITIGPFCNIRPSYTNVGKIYTSTLLKSTENLPDTARIVLPEGVWLKQSPTLEQTGPGKWQITQEWWHADSYDSFIYEAAI